MIESLDYSVRKMDEQRLYNFLRSAVSLKDLRMAGSSTFPNGRLLSAGWATHLFPSLGTLSLVTSENDRGSLAHQVRYLPLLPNISSLVIRVHEVGNNKVDHVLDAENRMVMNLLEKSELPNPFWRASH